MNMLKTVLHFIGCNLLLIFTILGIGSVILYDFGYFPTVTLEIIKFWLLVSFINLVISQIFRDWSDWKNLK